MLHNDAAQQRPGETPASAPEASQKLARAQGRANSKILTLTRKSSQPGDTNATSLTDGNVDSTHIIHIHGRHSPPPRVDLTTNATKSEPQQPHGPTKILRQNPKHLTRLARYHPFGEGHEQAHSGQWTEQEQLLRHATEDLQQNLEQNQHQEKSAEPWHDKWTHQASHTDSDTHSMHTAAPASRHPRHDSDIIQNSLNEKYRHTESAPCLALHHPFGEGHGHTTRSPDLCRGVSTDCNI